MAPPQKRRVVRPNGNPMRGSMSEELLVIKTFPNEQTALLAQAILEANGIASIVSADSASQMEPQLQFARGIRLSTRSVDATVARELLEPV